MNEQVTIIGAGLAGCTLAWSFYKRGEDFLLLEDKPESAGSLIAAGMLAPVTGKAFNPSWKIDDFYEPAMSFYSSVEKELNQKLWHPFSVVRLFFDADDRAKFENKRAKNIALEKWIKEVSDNIPHAIAEHGAVTWKGSGRLDVRNFVKSTRAFFSEKGQYKTGASEGLQGIKIYANGARGLITETPLALPQRSAKGEILTIHAPDLPQDRILSRGTWIVPTGKQNQTFLAGANYDWDHLTNTPTQDGLETVEKGIRSLTGLPYEVINHTAGVRPIVRRSEPVIGLVSKQTYVMNGLGSKGVLYAPKTAETLVNHIMDQSIIPSELDVAGVLN